MTPDDHRLVFIGGHHRSGTSLLHRCIRDHPSVSGFEDTGAVKDEGQHLQSVYPPGCRFGPVHRFAFDPRAHRTEASSLARENTARTLWNEWSAHWGDGPVLVEQPDATLERIYGFLGLESYTPDAEIQSGLNEQYYQLWRERPVGRLNAPPSAQQREGTAA